MPTILLIEDESELARVAQSYLQNGGFTVLTAARGDTGLSQFQQSKPDLVLLDLNLPGMDGLDVAREIRRQGETPIIMVTARVEETDRLIGLELGADDYITKPYSPRELVARVRAVLRRSGRAPAQPRKLQEGSLEVDLEEHSVTKAGHGIDLTPTEFNLLAALMAQPGRVFTRLQLLESAQGTAYEGYERTVDAHVKNLRAKLENDPKEPRLIETVFGVGYRFHKTE
ncbi:MAG: response regulator transcription factor [Anaerolineaceae bacterium]|nr:response regulator transcription factor [Anaerolineaceae bacterium]